jgi:hypothetical protein
VGPRAGLDGCGKSCPTSGLYPRTVQPVASRYTDWAIPAAKNQMGWEVLFYSVQSVCNIVNVMMGGCQECAAGVKQKEGDMGSAGCV